MYTDIILHVDIRIAICRLILPKLKYNFGKKTFIFSGVEVLNELPDKVTKAEKVRYPN